ncbi:hypothetical protein VTI74DRAFT_4688 [Chaetomium olivicolor]
MTQTTHEERLVSHSLLRKIDLLREKNIGKHVPLPQLVVVGDQSSGKSSLLESLTGIPFPRDVKLCTRYATQITQRLDDQFGIDICIMPGPNAWEEHKAWVEGYHRSMESLEELRAEFPLISQEVNNRMGLRAIPAEDTDDASNTLDGYAPESEEELQKPVSSVFSEDVLKIEIRGPDVDYLTVIDVPGIFRNLRSGVTTKEDMALVENMVRDYIKDSRTVILAVLASNVDIANQGILTLAEEYDPNGQRTLGILTKPDLVTEPSNQAAVCNIVRGKRKQLTMGYYVVRGRGADEGDEEYARREDTFKKEPWRSLPPERVGVKALKKRLTELLEHIARREFPNLRKEVCQVLRAAEREREVLGPPRSDEQEQRNFLMGVARKFEALVRAGLEAQYASHAAFARGDLRLITRVVNLADVFNDRFKSKAALRLFEKQGAVSTQEAIIDYGGDYERVNEGTDEEENEWSDGENDTVCWEEDIDQDEFPELTNIINREYDIKDPEQNIMEWLKTLYLRSRGMDLGAFSSAVWTTAWKEQSSKWSKISKAFIHRVVLAIHRFINAAIHLVCIDPVVREELWSAILDELLRRYETGMKAVDFLVSTERDTKPYTLGCQFNENRQRLRGERMAAHLGSQAPYRFESMDDTDALQLTIGQVRTTMQSMSNLDDIVEKLHDDLASYYDIARKRFVDNVLNQAVNYHLLFGPSTPLGLFSQDWVMQLNADQLKIIAGDSPSVVERREMLERKIDDLRKAKDILR